MICIDGQQFAPAGSGGRVMVAIFALAAALALGFGAAGDAQAAARRADPGPAPAGCWWGPRGGLHCPRHVKSSSEESATQRDKRLMRECRGRPNAGACLGYAR